MRFDYETAVKVFEKSRSCREVNKRYRWPRRRRELDKLRLLRGRGGKETEISHDMGWQLYWGRTYHRGDSASRDTNEWPKMTRNITAYLPAADARFWRCICGKKTETLDFHPQRPPPCFTCLSIFHLSTCRSYGWRFRLRSTRLGWIRVSVTKYNETLDCSVDFSTWNVLVP